MRWLLLKDLQILRRSPLLVALLVIYPVVIAVLFGFALSGGPEKPRVAFANLVAPGESTFTAGIVPATFIVNRQGEIAYQHHGAANWNSETIRRFLTELAER